MDQKITECSKDVSRHINFKKDTLEKLATAIIDKTSKSKVGFKIRVEQYAESSKPAKSVTVDVQLEKAYSRIVLQIQLADCIEKWKVDIYLKKDTQKNPSIFFDEIKRAAAIICAEESGRHLLSEKKPKAITAPVQKAESIGVDTATIAVVTVPQAKEKRTRRNAALLVPDELVLKILLDWMQLSKGVQTIDQREFWGIAMSLGVARKDVPTVLAILKRKMIIEEISIKYKPQIKLAQLGLDLLDKQKQQTEKEKLEAEKSSHLQRAHNIPKLILSPLKKVRDAQAVQAQLSETRAKKDALIEKIKTLQAELVEGGKELTKIEAREKNQLGEIERLLSQISSARVAEMIKIGEEAFRQRC